MPIARLVDADVLYALAVIGVLQLVGVDVVGAFMDLWLSFMGDLIEQTTDSVVDGVVDSLKFW